MSSLSILTIDRTLISAIERRVAPFDWTVHAARAAQEAFPPQEAAPALVLIDGALAIDVRVAAVKAIRSLDGWASGTPILLVLAAGQEDQPGVNDRIGAPVEEAALIEAVERWAGPLADHRFRDPANPHYRLVRLGGRLLADGMLLRFAEQLEEALDTLAGSTDIARIAHNIAGLAGTIGYAHLSASWSAIERGESTDREGASAMSRAVIADISRRIPGA